MKRLIADPKSLDAGRPERVVFYPTLAHLDPSGGDWHVSIRGAIHGPTVYDRRNAVLLRLLRRLLDVDASELESDVFRERIRHFLSSSVGRRQVVVDLAAGQREVSLKSHRSGHFRGRLRIPSSEAGLMEQSGHLADGWLNINVASCAGRMLPCGGSVKFLGRLGISIISDIDDTIKHTDVCHRRSLLHNTFLKKFEPVEGMATLYRRWAEHGVDFHYVSSSPWQLYNALEELCRREGFPRGTFHLRSVRFRDPSIVKLLIRYRRGKRRTIRALVRMFPQRRFVLVGDSGEADPEIYGWIARWYPQQVARILIRDVSTRPMTPHRRERAFGKLPRCKWQVFVEPGELGPEHPWAD